MKKLVTLALTFAALAMVSGCKEAPVTPQLASIQVSSLPPLRVNVAQINVIENYHSPMQAPNVEHQFATPPAMALKQWAGQRLVAAGSQGVLEVTIEDASVRETQLPKTKGITGFFTDDQDARFDAHIRVTFRLYDGVNAISMAQAEVDVSRSQTINEKATLAQRETLFNQLTQEMIARFDSEADQRLHSYFAAYLIL